jgi:hypothetical protein
MSACGAGQKALPIYQECLGVKKEILYRFLLIARALQASPISIFPRESFEVNANFQHS